MAKFILNILIIIALAIPYRGFSQVVSSNSAGNEQAVSSQTADTNTVSTGKGTPKKEKKKSVKSNKVSFETFDLNYAKALKYYENGQYLSAARLFEELYPLSLGTPVADTLLFLFADCYYKNKDYELAAFHFKDYARHYPGTEKAEEAHFMCVKSVFEVSPVYSVDQSSTLYAIDEMDLFIKTYPYSKHVDECNEMLDLLREKLAQKDFEIAKLYYNTDHYQAAQIAVKNFLKEYPNSKYAHEAVYILVKNNHEYARKSVNSKKKERYQACVDAYKIMQAQYPNSGYYMDAKKLADDALQQISKIKNQNNNQ
ncbi:MAG: outer membrane protein assembly factor BamD [Bacteroidales bacterium]|jgi:outer membrane protein assembly factor BamD|nr:outer membrane protein assembly factor BamD [Bacteroidales bacterium]